MCGRYTLFTPASELAERFETAAPDVDARYNCAPGQDLPVITGTGEFTHQRWGLLPEWADDRSQASINARAETLTEKPSFAESVEHRRCLVPADGFYEWVNRDESTQPYRVAFEDGRPFAMAGIWSRWQPPTRQTGLGEFGTGTVSDPEPIDTFAIVTTEPNDLIADLHHRMAVILDPSEESTWLHGDIEDALACCDPYPATDLTAHPVSTRVNDPSNDDPSLVQETTEA
ncbi:SOS response-associated peptidase [Haloplanus sp. C73]|uniref:SOS response-associated peptidase n=1 Tax=Haloplanus sp. C73 TaxID=3421641 RepID=UPI003EBF9D8B